MPTTNLKISKPSQMSVMARVLAALTRTPCLPFPPSPLHSTSTHPCVRSKSFSNHKHGPLFSRSKTLRIRSFRPPDEEKSNSSAQKSNQNGRESGVDDVLELQQIETSVSETSFLARLAIGLGIAATVTIFYFSQRWPSQGSTLGLPVVSHVSSASASTVPYGGFTLKVFGYQVILPEYAPGWIYFSLLMAAGCGLFVSEEALNIWVGISLARLLSLDGSWVSFAESFSRNASYIISTVLWVYWGVCISDMIPFYLGKLFRQTGASDDICSKLGIDKKKAMNITRAVQKYGNLIGFVERFSVGVRNPTAFLAGSLGISPECFFAGVCGGGLITLPVQLAIGIFLREHPVVALASVATVVGTWTIFPYAMAASTALYFFLRGRYSSQ